MCEPTVAASCDSLSPSVVASLPLPIMQSLLSRTELKIKEDVVFEVIQEFIEEHGKSHSAEEIAELWSCCRLPFLSYDAMAYVARIPEIPQRLLADGMMGFHFVQTEQLGGDKAKAFIQSSTNPTLFQRRMINPTKFNPDLVGEHIELSQENTVATAKEDTDTFSESIVGIDAKFEKESSFTFTIRALETTWTAVGLVEEKKSRQALAAEDLGHGFYLLASSGRTWHSTSSDTHMGFLFVDEDVIKVSYNDGTLTFEKGDETWCLTDITTDDVLIPCSARYRISSNPLTRRKIK